MFIHGVGGDAGVEEEAHAIQGARFGGAEERNLETGGPVPEGIRTAAFRKPLPGVGEDLTLAGPFAPGLGSGPAARTVAPRIRIGSPLEEEFHPQRISDPRGLGEERTAVGDVLARIEPSVEEEPEPLRESACRSARK